MHLFGPCGRESKVVIVMNRWFRLAVVLVFSCAASSVSARADWRQTAGRQISRAVDQLSSAGVRVGFFAVDLTSGKVVYEHQADRRLVPASNVKLAVTVAALELLGADFEFETRLVRLGDDLVVIGGGDPAVGDPRMCAARGEQITAVFERWAAKLRADGLVRLDGDLVVDDGVFESHWLHDRWPGKEHASWYRAPVGGLNFNDGCVEVEVWPGAKAGAAAGFRLIPPAAHIKVVNKCVTGGRNKPVVWRSPTEERLVISGRCSKRGRLQPVAVYDPGMFFGWACKGALASSGVTVAGTVRRARVCGADGSLPAGAELLAVERSALPEIIARCNKRSQNLFAECLIKMIGLRVKGQGSWASGCEAVGEFLRRVGLPPESYRIDDGSGLSRGNELSARGLVQLLRWARRHGHGEVLIDSLPIAGIDGSLKRRLNDPALRGKIRAKTGSLAGVSALSGYADGPDGPIAFSMLFNGIGKHGGLVRTSRVRICRALVGTSAQSTKPAGAAAR